MREAVHIFLKDTQQFRYPIIILLGWTVVFVVAGTRPPSPFPAALSDWSTAFASIVPVLSGFVFPAGWAYLISQVIHAEALPGDRQFWLTRPYRRTSLFAAKAMFVTAYIILPIALAQGAIAVSQGLPLASYLPGLVWEQLLITAVVILPAAAVASVTSTLAQYVVVGLVAPLLFVATTFLKPWQGIEWIRTSAGLLAMVVVTGTVLFVQFHSRRTAASRIFALVGILATVIALPLFPWNTAFALQSRLVSPWNGTLAANLLRPEPKPGQPQPAQATRPPRFMLLFRVEGPPAGTSIACEAAEVSVASVDGQIGNADLAVVGGSVGMSQVPDGCPISVRIPVEVRDALADRLVSIHATLYLTVFGRQSTTVPTGAPPTLVPNVGMCRSTRYDDPFSTRGIKDHGFTRVSCVTAFRPPSLTLFAPMEGFPSSIQRGRTYSPFPANLRIQPVEHGYFEHRYAVDAVITTVEPVAHVRTTVDVQGVYLRDFEL